MRRRFINNRHVAYNQTEYLSFEALEDGFVLTFPQNLKYSINGGVWKNLPSYTRTKPINSGDIISLQGDCEIFTYEGVGTFNFNKKCNVFGNILSIIGYKNLQAHAFVNLFANGTIVDSSNLILPIDLTVFCYSNMFYNCKSLVKAPELPATTLADDCYGSMFYGCTSLKEAPELPATTLARYCYGSMFSNCTSLVNAPELPATTLADNCYYNMFSGCTSLVNAPELPATTLKKYCYSDMFYGCTSLTQAPELPATTLTKSCYSSMFKGCRKLNYIKMLATDISASNCLLYWVSEVSSTGTFVKNKNANWYVTGINGVPAGWAVITEEEESNPLNVILNINTNNGEEGVRVYNYISERAPWISSAFDNFFIEGLYEGSMLSAKVINALIKGNTLVLSYEGQGNYDMCSLSSDGYLELVLND